MNALLSKNLISTKEASELSGYSPDYLARLARSGEIESTRVGRTWLVGRESLVRFLKARGRNQKELAGLVSAKEASKEFGYNADYLARLAREGAVEGTRVGRTWLVKRESLAQFLTAQTERKEAHARALARAREEEYRVRNAVPALTDHSVYVYEPVSAPHTPVTPHWRSSVFAFALACVVMVSAAAVARTDLLPQTTALGSTVAAALSAPGATPTTIASTLARAVVATGEYVALGTYDTINSFFRSGHRFLARLFDTSPTIVFPSVPHPLFVVAPASPSTSTTTTKNIYTTAYPTYTTIVQGISKDFVDQSLAALRLNIDTTIRPFLERPTSHRSSSSITLTTLGTSGAATFNGDTLNIPQYTAGSGSGTVESGTAGQVAFYAANGTTLTATSSLFIAASSNVGIGSTTPGTTLSLGTSGTDTINISTTATSTFGHGINLREGCFAINGTCVGTGSGTGTVTSVALTTPTGLSVTGSPITTSGVFALSLTAGYTIPLVASTTEWDAAYQNRITSATAPLSLSNHVLSISQATASVDGYLSATDWNTFNTKFATTSSDFWLAQYDKGFFFSTTSADYWGNTKGYLTSLTGAASSTLLADNNTWSGVNRFTSLFATNATTTSQYITSLTSQLLRTDGSGQVTGAAVGSGLSFDGTTLSATGGTGTVSTSTNEVAGQLPYWTTTSGTPARLGSIATTSLSFSGPFTGTSALGALVGGSNSTIVYTGLATTSQPASSNLLVSNGGAGVYGVATTTASCAGSNSCSDFTVLGSSPVTITGAGTTYAFPFTPATYAGQTVNATSTGLWLTGSPLSLIASSTFATYASTTQLTNSGNTYLTGLSTGALYLGQDSLVSSVATSSVTAGTGVSFTGTPGALIGGTALTITNTGLLSLAHEYGSAQTGALTLATSTTAINNDWGITNSSGVFTFNLPSASATVRGLLTATDWATFNAKQAALSFTYPLVNALNTVSLAFGTTTANTWGAHNSFTSLFATNASSTNATTTSQYITSLTSQLLRTDGSGQVTGATVGSGLSFDGTTLSATGGSGTVATSTNEIAGQLPYWTTTSGTPARLGSVATSTLSFSTFPAALSGTLGTLVGGTNSTLSWWGLATTTDLVAGNLLYGSGANGVANVATSSVTAGTGVTFTGTPGALVGGTSLTINTPWTINGNDIYKNNSGNVGIGTTTPGSLLSLGNTGTDTINISTTATSTFGYGFNLRNGCYAVNGVCVGSTAFAASSTLLADNNTWGGTNTFSTTPILGTLTGLVGANSGTLYSVASSSLFGFTPISNALAKGNFIVGDDSGTAQATSSIFISSIGQLGIGTTSPFANLSIHANNGSINKTLFAIGSSTQSATTTFFSISNTGAITVNGPSPAAPRTDTQLMQQWVTGVDSAANVAVDAFGGFMVGTHGSSPGYFSKEAFEAPGVAITYNARGANAAGTGLYYDSTDFASLFVQRSGNFTFYTAPSGTAAASITATPRMTILNGGNVGIGTTTPARTLTISSSTAPQLMLTDASLSSDAWNFRSINGNLYIATSSPSTFATSTLAALIIDSNSNLGVGVTTPTSKLDVGGSVNVSALSSYKQGGSTILFAPAVNQGTFVGIGAGSTSPSTLGAGNSALGYQALGSANAAAIGNTAIGQSALFTNSSGLYNTAVGQTALNTNLTGQYNTATGANALFTNSTGNYNTAFGANALNVVTGSSNIGIGFQAGASLTTGSNNIIIGNSIDLPAVGSSNMLSIGNLIYGTGLSDYNPTSSSALSTGNIGIGTSSPARRLTISSSTAPQLMLTDASLSSDAWNFRSAGSALYIATSSPSTFATSTTAALTIDSNGWLGLATSTPGSIFSINNVANFTNATSTFYGNGLNLTSGCYAISGTCAGTIGTGTTGQFPYYAANGTALTATSSLFIATSGKIGISNTSPTADLSFSETLSDSKIYLYGDTSKYGFGVRNSQLMVYSGADGSSSGGVTFGKFDGTTFTEHMRVRNDGNVGIGLSTPGSKLQVDGGVSIAFTPAAPTNGLIVAGKVGFGTSTPNNVLDVYSTGKAAIGFSGAANDTYKWTIGMDVTNGGRFTIASSTALGTVDRFIINGNGNVGIGTTSPIATLGIQGSLGVNASQLYLAANGNVGIGTTTPTWLLNPSSATAAQLALSAGAGVGQWAFRNAGGNLYVATTTVAGTATSSTSALTIIGATGNVGIGTTTPTALLTIASTSPSTSTVALEVAGRFSKFNASGDASVSAWLTGGATATSTISQAIESNGYVYAFAGLTTGGGTGIEVAPINADGSLGTWKTNQYTVPSDHPTATAVVTYNGYMYALGGCNNTNFCTVAFATVYYAKLNADGSTGPWKSTTAMPGVRSHGAATVANGYVYYHGGTTNNFGAANTQKTIYYAKLNADGSVGTWNTTTNTDIGARKNHQVLVANGLYYVVGGHDLDFATASSTVQYASISTTGDLGTFTTATNNMPAGRAFGRAAISNGKLYVMGGVSGNNGLTAASTVFYTRLLPTGDVDVWSTNPESLPAVRMLFGSVVANGYMYAIGGSNGSVGQTTMYYSSLARTQFAGNLDLLGLNTSGAIGNVSGDAGSSIYAGSGFFGNRLQVSGNTELWNGLSVSGASSFLAGTTTQASPFFNVATSSDASFFSVLTSGNVGIGSTTPWGTLSVNPANQATGIPSFVVGSSTKTDFIVTQSGNIGIGSTTPAAQLGIVGATPAGVSSGAGTSASPALMIRGGTGGATSAIAAAGVGGGLILDGGVGGANTNGTNSIGNVGGKGGSFIWTAGTGGTVGTGVFNVGGAGGDVVLSAGTGGAATSGTHGDGGSLTLSAGIPGGSSGAGGYFAVQTGPATGLVERLRIVNTGLTGVGSTTPWANFSVNPANQTAGVPSFVVGSSTKTDFIVMQSGNTGIGTTSPWRSLSLAGTMSISSTLSTTVANANALCVNSSTFEVFRASGQTSCISSSQRYKHDIATLPDGGLETVMNLRPVSFFYNQEVDSSQTAQIGFIAEEMAILEPRLTTYDANGLPNSVKYEQTTALLTKAIQELNTHRLNFASTTTVRLDSLESRLAMLESGAVSTASGAGFSTSTLTAALGDLGILVQNNIAQFGTLVSRQFVASADSDGTSSAASVTIDEGSVGVEITNVLVRPSTKIFITFNSRVMGSWWVEDKDDGSFRVALSEAQDQDVEFDYFLVQTEGQLSTHESATSTPAYSVTQESGVDAENDATPVIDIPITIIDVEPPPDDSATSTDSGTPEVAPELTPEQSPTPESTPEPAAATDEASVLPDAASPEQTPESTPTPEPAPAPAE